MKRLVERRPPTEKIGTVKPTVISIIGSGHSGSTVLDIVLGSHPNIAGVGELHKLPRAGWVLDDDRRCACGSPVHECAYWTRVFARWIALVGRDGPRRYLALQHTYERSIRSLPRLLIEERRPSSRFMTYSEITAALYEAIRDVTGTSAIVDSSKNPVRTYALLANPRLDVRVIHLVRDGRGVVWSKLKSFGKDVQAGVRSDRQPTRPARTTLHWVLANLESEWVAKRADPTHTLRVAYESFVEHPDRVLRQISRVVGEDLGPLADAVGRGVAMDPYHLVGGNRVRMSGAVALRPDVEWMVKLPSRDVRMFWRLAGWLARRYGYSR